MYVYDDLDIAARLAARDRRAAAERRNPRTSTADVLRVVERIAARFPGQPRLLLVEVVAAALAANEEMRRAGVKVVVS